MSFAINAFIDQLWKLGAAHAVTDCLLQDPKLFSIGYFKNRHRRDATKAFGEDGHHIYWLIAHGFLNGLGVWWATGSIGFGIAETLCHIAIDYGKIEKYYGVHRDQAFHGLCKIVWAILTTV